MKRILVSFLITIPLLCVAQGKISVASFEQDLASTDALTYPQLDPNGEKCAIIKVETDQTGFQFDAGYATVVKIEQRTGEIWVWLQPGVRQISIFHQHLGVIRNYQLPFPLQSGKVYILKLTTGTVRTIVEDAKKQTGFLIITSEPEGADVYLTLNGKENYGGKTPFQKKMEYGSYNYRVSKSRYHDDVGVAHVDKTRVEVKSILRAAFGSIMVNSTPSGASVFLDGENTGKVTPCTLQQIQSNRHEIRLQAGDNYYPFTQEVTVSDGKTTNVTAILEPCFATVTINSLQGAEIRINGERKGSGSVSLDLNEGIYDVEATLSHHRTATRQIEVRAKQPVSITLEPTPIYGSLDVITLPLNVSVAIDGKDYGVTPLSVENLLEGEHTVTLSKAGHATETRRVNIAEGQTETLDVKLASGRAVRISTDRAGDRIEIDGNFAGNSPLSTQLSFGSHTVVAVRDGKRASKSVNIEQGQSEIAVKLGFGLQPQFAPSVTSAQRRVLEQLVADMVKVEGGTFTMGATSEQGGDAYDDEKPTHSVSLSDYYIGKYEVTQAQWKTVMGSNPSRFNGDNLPVEMVSWVDCQSFIQKLNQLTGLNFRLPTEAEWEYAARGGKKNRGYKYAGGNDIGKAAWYDSNSRNKTHSVGTKQASELGLYDMSGNVWEWCQDWFGKYSSSSQTNPTGPHSGSNRVFRGGSWNNSARFCRVSIRNFNSPGNRYNFLGLRLALSSDAEADSALTSSETLTQSPSTADVRTFTVSGVNFDMVKIEGGTFTMGATAEQGSDADNDEKPAHSVTLSDYYIGKYEVTQALWKAVMGSNKSCFKGDNHPAETFGQNDCQTFIRKLNQLTGLNFRLPTEAEWEYAARGGKKSKGYKYSGSNTLGRVAWYGENSQHSTHPVGEKLPNELGIYDMSGNVCEQCQDLYGPYPSFSQTNPTGGISGTYHVYRGGNYDNAARACRVSYRFHEDYDDDYLHPGLQIAYRVDNFGLRLALSIE